MRSIPCALIRGGSSRGAYFLAEDLPADEAQRNALLVKIMGGPDALQVDGIGGGHPLTSKVAVLAPSRHEEIDVDYLFLQVDPERQTVSDAQNCGNILAGVGVYALHKAMLPALRGTTEVRVRMLNSGAVCHLDMPTPLGELRSHGETAIDGVPGTAAPIVCNYIDIAGSACGALLPTGNVVDLVDGIETTCVDNGMPVALLRAVDFGLSGREAPDALDANEQLRARLESIRRQIGPAMNLGDVQDKSVPKMCLVSPAEHGGLIMTRTFIPHVCHRTIGVLGAVSVATACLLPGSVARDITSGRAVAGAAMLVEVEHAAGALGLQLQVDDEQQISKAGVVRTARLLFDGEVMV